MNDYTPPAVVALWVYKHPHFDAADVQNHFARYNSFRVGNTMRFYHYGDSFPEYLADNVSSVCFLSPALSTIGIMYSQLQRFKNIKYYEGVVWNTRRDEEFISILENKFNGGIISFYPRCSVNNAEDVALFYADHLEKGWIQRRKPEWQVKFRQRLREMEEFRMQKKQEAEAKAALKRPLPDASSAEISAKRLKEEAEQDEDEEVRARLLKTWSETAADVDSSEGDWKKPTTHVAVWVYKYPQFESPLVRNKFAGYKGRVVKNTHRYYYYGDVFPEELAATVLSVSFFATNLSTIGRMLKSVWQYKNIKYFEGGVWDSRKKEKEHVTAFLETRFNGGRIMFYSPLVFETPSMAADLFAGWLDRYWLDRRTPEFRIKFEKEAQARKLAAEEKARKRALEDAVVSKSCRQRRAG